MKRHSAVILALLILLMTPSAAAPSPERLAAASGSAAISSREETIYIDMDADGSIKEVVSVVRLKVDEAGNYTDFGGFSSVANLTNGLEPSLSSDSVSWSFPEAYPGFVYQGVMKNQALPFEVKLSYSLNGVDTSPSALPGAIGEVVIHVEFTRTQGASPYFEEQFMAQLQLSFPADRCTVVEDGGSVAAFAGSTRTLTLSCLPGQNLAADIKLDCAGFELSQASLAMTPYDLASILAGNMPELDFTELSDGLGQMYAGLEEIKKGTEELKTGSSELSEGIGTSAAAAKQLKEGAAQLELGMSQIDTAVAQYETLFNSYITGGDQFIKLFKSLVKASSDLSGGVSQLSAGLDELFAASGKIPEGAQGLVDGEQALMSSFQELHAAIDGAAEQFMGGEGDKAEPVSFVNGSAEIGSVQFVGNIKAITIPSKEKEAPPAEKPSSFWDKLVGLFT